MTNPIIAYVDALFIRFLFRVAPLDSNGYTVPLHGLENFGNPGTQTGPTNPFFVAPRTPQNITITAYTIPAATSWLVSAVNPTRKSIQILNTGTGLAYARPSPAVSGGVTTPGNVSATANAASAATGYPLQPAAGALQQGGSTPIYDGASTSIDEWDVYSVAGTTILVIEGN